jgi:uncharacterized membrane protein (UPF0127 family)
VAPLLRHPAAPCTLRNIRNGQSLAARICCAFDSRSRRLGLLSRDRFDSGEALIIAPSNAVHTFGMRFPIDIAFVARDGRIVKSRSSVPRSRIVAALRWFAVVELPAGTLRRHDTVDGDRLVIESARQTF